MSPHWEAHYVAEALVGGEQNSALRLGIPENLLVTMPTQAYISNILG